MKKIIVFIAGAILGASPVWAYSDRIDAPAAEIYETALVCFEKEGISKSNDKKMALTTKWIQETIRRTRERSFIPTRLKESVDVRYRLKMDIEEGNAYSDVWIRGSFEEKPADAPLMQPWKASPSNKEFYFKEREAFFKLLNCLEERKKTPAPVPAA